MSTEALKQFATCCKNISDVVQKCLRNQGNIRNVQSYICGEVLKKLFKAKKNMNMPSRASQIPTKKSPYRTHGNGPQNVQEKFGGHGLAFPPSE